MNLKPFLFFSVLIIVLIFHIFLLGKTFYFVHDLQNSKLKMNQSNFVRISFVEEKKSVEEKPKVFKKAEPKKNTVANTPKKREISQKIEQIKKQVVAKTPPIANEPKIIKPEQVTKSKALSKITSTPKDAQTKNNEIIEKEYVTEYIKYINETIQANKFYPKLAKNMGLEGKCILSLKILNTGEVATVNIDEKSDFVVLNEAALDIIKKIGTFKAFPAFMNKKFIILNIPLKYTLKG